MIENNTNGTPIAQDQLSFLDFLIIILKYKWLIIAIVTITTIITIIYIYGDMIKKNQSSTPAPTPASIDSYYSGCVIELHDDVLKKAKRIIKDNKVLDSVLKTTNLTGIS
jgi:hypothetical protein